MMSRPSLTRTYFALFGLAIGFIGFGARAEETTVSVNNLAPTQASYGEDQVAENARKIIQAAQSRTGGSLEERVRQVLSERPGGLVDAVRDPSGVLRPLDGHHNAMTRVRVAEMMAELTGVARGLPTQQYVQAFLNFEATYVRVNVVGNFQGRSWTEFTVALLERGGAYLTNQGVERLRERYPDVALWLRRYPNLSPDEQRRLAVAIGTAMRDGAFPQTFSGRTDRRMTNSPLRSLVGDAMIQAGLNSGLFHDFIQFQLADWISERALAGDANLNRILEIRDYPTRVREFVRFIYETPVHDPTGTFDEPLLAYLALARRLDPGRAVQERRVNEAILDSFNFHLFRELRLLDPGRTMTDSELAAHGENWTIGRRIPAALRAALIRAGTPEAEVDARLSALNQMVQVSRRVTRLLMGAPCVRATITATGGSPSPPSLSP